MNRKGLSAVIATILMLMITIALGGMAWLFVSGFFTGRTSQTFFIISTRENWIAIKNDGSAAISDLTATVDGNPVKIAVTPNLPNSVAYWSFNDGSGSLTAVDNTGNGRTGTLTNMNTTGNATSGWDNTTCEYGSCLRFDGVNDYVNVASTGSLNFGTSSFTLSGWFKAYSTQPNLYPRLIDKETGSNVGWFVYIEQSTPYALRARLNTKVTTFNTGVQDGNWHHFAFVCNKTIAKVLMYVDGVKETTELDITGEGTVTNSVSLKIGNSVSSDYFNGTIDEVNIYNRALKSDEVMDLVSGLVVPGDAATVKILTTLTSGAHTAVVCSPSTCQSTQLKIR